MSPPRRMPHRATESVPSGNVIRIHGAHEPAYGIEYHLSLCLRLLSRLRILESQCISLSIDIPFHMVNRRVQLRIRGQAILAIKAVPVRTNFRLRDEVAGPVGVEFG